MQRRVLRRPRLYNCRMSMLRLTAALLATAIAGCSTDDPEAEIRALLAAAEQAAEDRDTHHADRSQALW